MIIKNPQLREKVFGFLDQCHLAETNYLQQAVIFSSFIHCEEWYQKLLGYLADNIAFVKATIENIAQTSLLYMEELLIYYFER